MKKKYKVYLSSGKPKVITARTPTQARYKYYGGASHFKTEYAVTKVRRYKK